MKTAWRSWFWNISLIFVMTVAAAICTGVALSEVNSFAAVGFGVVSVIFGLVLFVRRCWVWSPNRMALWCVS